VIGSDVCECCLAEAGRARHQEDGRIWERIRGRAIGSVVVRSLVRSAKDEVVPALEPANNVAIGLTVAKEICKSARGVFVDPELRALRRVRPGSFLGLWLLRMSGLLGLGESLLEAAILDAGEYRGDGL
jgi:hypothetical protein